MFSCLEGLLGWEDRVGVIEARKYADLIGLEGDPLIDISTLQHVQFVMNGGKVQRDASVEPGRDRAR